MLVSSCPETVLSHVAEVWLFSHTPKTPGYHQKLPQKKSNKPCQPWIPNNSVNPDDSKLERKEPKQGCHERERINLKLLNQACNGQKSYLFCEEVVEG